MSLSRKMKLRKRRKEIAGLITCPKCHATLVKKNEETEEITVCPVCGWIKPRWEGRMDYAEN